MVAHMHEADSVRGRGDLWLELVHGVGPDHTALMHHTAHDRHLVVDDVDDARVNRAYRQRRAYLVATAVAIIVAFIAPLVAVGIYITLAVAFLIQPLIGMWRRH